MSQTVIRKWVSRLTDRCAYVLAVLPVLTDWIDTGHWPAHPREFATEIIIGVMILFGVHRLYRRAERFRALAETDVLTGLRNRARFRHDLSTAIDQARTSGLPLTLALIDVDRFKQVNDRWGHPTGDEVLQNVARALARSIREGTDGAYRIGGDEFAVLLSNADCAAALSVLSRSFARIKTANDAPVSCSAGLVSWVDGDDPDAMLQRADRLMYAAKPGAPPTTHESGVFSTLTNRPSSGKATPSGRRLVPAKTHAA